MSSMNQDDFLTELSTKFKDLTKGIDYYKVINDTEKKYLDRIMTGIFM